LKKNPAILKLLSCFVSSKVDGASDTNPSASFVGPTAIRTLLAEASLSQNAQRKQIVIQKNKASTSLVDPQISMQKQAQPLLLRLVALNPQSGCSFLMDAPCTAELFEIHRVTQNDIRRCE